MLIRSQNKMEIHNINKIAMLKIVPLPSEYIVTVNSQYTIGTYKTQNEALKVLDDIQYYYTASQGKFEDAYNYAVYQMP